MCQYSQNPNQYIILEFKINMSEIDKESPITMINKYKDSKVKIKILHLFYSLGPKKMQLSLFKKVNLPQVWPNIL